MGDTTRWDEFSASTAVAEVTSGTMPWRVISKDLVSKATPWMIAYAVSSVQAMTFLQFRNFVAEDDIFLSEILTCMRWSCLNSLQYVSFGCELDEFPKAKAIWEKIGVHAEKVDVVDMKSNYKITPADVEATEELTARPSFTFWRCRAYVDYIPVVSLAASTFVLPPPEDGAWMEVDFFGFVDRKLTLELSHRRSASKSSESESLSVIIETTKSVITIPVRNIEDWEQAIVPLEAGIHFDPGVRNKLNIRVSTSTIVGKDYYEICSIRILEQLVSAVPTTKLGLEVFN